MSAVEVPCPRCGELVELDVMVRPRFIADADGAAYVTATTRAGRTNHACGSRRHG